MDSVDKLRAYEDVDRFESMEPWDVAHIADAIEREIQERYMKLPVDADGVPIRPGDMLEYDYGDISGKHAVIALIYDDSRRMDFDGGIWDFEFDDDVDGNDTRVVNCMSDFYSCNRHVKPRTLEDVLHDFAYKVCDLSVDECEIAKYADEIRELLAGDAE